MVCCHMDMPHFAYPLMDIEVISMRLDIINDTAGNSAYKSFCECLFSFLLSRYEWVIMAAFRFEGWKGQDSWRMDTALSMEASFAREHGELWSQTQVQTRPLPLTGSLISAKLLTSSA